MFPGYINNSEWMTTARQVGEGAAWRSVTVRFDSEIKFWLSDYLEPPGFALGTPLVLIQSSFVRRVSGFCGEAAVLTFLFSTNAPHWRRSGTVTTVCYCFWPASARRENQLQPPAACAAEAREAHKDFSVSVISHKELVLVLLRRLRFALLRQTVDRLQIKSSPGDTIRWALWGLIQWPPLVVSEIENPPARTGPSVIRVGRHFLMRSSSPIKVHLENGFVSTSWTQSISSVAPAIVGQEKRKNCYYTQTIVHKCGLLALTCTISGQTSALPDGIG